MDIVDYLALLRALEVTPHVAQNNAITKTGRTRSIDDRTTRHSGYGMSQSLRAMIECIFGWGKQHGTMRKTKQRGLDRVAADFLLNLIAYILVRITKLVAAQTAPEATCLLPKIAPTASTTAERQENSQIFGISADR